MNFEDKSDKELWELTTDDDPSIQLHALYHLTGRLYERSAFSDLMSPAMAGIAIAESQEDKNLEFELRLISGRSLIELDRVEEALPQLTDAAEIARIHLSEVSLADCIMSIATCHLQLDQFAEAESNWRAAAALFLSNGRETAAGIAHLEIGELLGRMDRQSEALSIFRGALDTFKSVGDLIGSGRAYDRIAACLIDLGDLTTAIENLREAHNIFEYTQDEGRLRWAQYRLGWTLVTYGNYSEAIPLLVAASESYKFRNEFVKAANVDTQLAHAYYEIGRVAEALELYEKVRSVFQGAGETTDALIADVNFARRLRFEDNERAVSILSRVIEEGNVIEDSWIVRAATLRMAEYFIDRKTIADAENALQLLKDFSETDYGDNMPDRVRYKFVIAKANFEIGDRTKSIDLARELTTLSNDSGFQFERAAAYELLAIWADEKLQDEEANLLYSRAIALYLAAGMGTKATRLSQRFLQDDVSQQSDLPLNKFDNPQRNEDTES